MTLKFLDQLKNRTNAEIVDILCDNAESILDGSMSLPVVATRIIDIVDKGMMLAYHNAYEDGAYAINENYKADGTHGS